MSAVDRHLYTGSDEPIREGDVILLLYNQQQGRVTQIDRDAAGEPVAYRIRWLYHVYADGDGYSTERPAQVRFLRRD